MSSYCKDVLLGGSPIQMDPLEIKASPEKNSKILLMVILAATICGYLYLKKNRVTE